MRLNPRTEARAEFLKIMACSSAHVRPSSMKYSCGSNYRTARLVRLNDDACFQVGPVPNSTTGGRRQIAVQGRHPGEHLVENLPLVVFSEIVRDFVEVFAPARCRFPYRAPETQWIRFQQPEYS